MDDALLGEVLTRLDGDHALDEQAQLLVLAACQGDDELTTALRDEPVARPEPTAEATAPAEAAAPAEPAGAFLRSVTVEGFRGVGPTQTLELTPGPGFTLVVGRNGSGKSSFAEALELLLTGHNLRWRDRSMAWREGWRNLHHPVARIAADLVVEGSAGATTVTCTWPDDGDLDDRTVAVQPVGRPKTDVASLGWEEALVAYRPFLSYNELGSMLDEGPSKLYDALEAILGLDELNVAAERLRQARLDRERAVKQVKADLKALLPALEASDDPRARAALGALGGRTWQLDEVERAVMDRPADDAEDAISLLRALAALALPDAEAVGAAAADLRAAADAFAEVAGTDAADAERLAGLLERALAVHDHRGDGDCPVCGRTGALDAAWHKHATAEVARLRAEARAVTDARAALDRALRGARGLAAPPPVVLDRSEGVGVETADAAELWRAWSRRAQEDMDPTALAEHLASGLAAVAEAAAQVRKAAVEELDRRQDAWHPLARDLAAWLQRALEAEAGGSQVGALKSAEAWLKDTTAALRDHRFAPIADRCAAYWSKLRQHSNVELGRVELTGTASRRRVALDVTVDGVAGAALGVMSQGELHALALSLFLPRATLPASDFRFLVIDDPVQSMDPARVDGLARVLADVARDRQVVVFTHDDRLAEAVRRLELTARVLEVTRRARSVVELREVTDPVARLIEDARVLALTEDLPAGVGARVVPGMCRAALEAACIEVVRRRRLGRGDAHLDVETDLAAATTLTQKAALALFDDLARGADVLGRLGQLGRGAATTFKACNRGVHEGYDGNLIGLVDDAAHLAAGLRRP